MSMGEVIASLFSNVWSLFKGVTVPGFNVSLAVVTVGFLVIRLSILAISLVTGFRSGASNAVLSYNRSAERATSYKSHVDGL